MKIKENNWEKLWNKRTFDYSLLNTKDDKIIFKELKRANGFDVINDGLTYSALIKQQEDIKNNFASYFDDKDFSHIKSVYEVGCGCGGNLYLFNKEGLLVGGIDYSRPLIEVAKKVLNSCDLVCEEAINMPREPLYDVVLSNSVFSYFENEDYANKVLDIIYNKTKYAIGIIDIHDIAKKDDFINFRIKNVEDYLNRYKDLPKLFYSKDFFKNFAKNHNMKIVFEESKINGYWNNDFVFNCYLYK